MVTPHHARVPPTHAQLAKPNAAPFVLADLLAKHGAAAVCCYDAKDRIVFWNDLYIEFFPEVADRIKWGTHFTDTVRPFLQVQHPGATDAEIEAGVNAAWSRHREAEGPIRYQRADTGRWFELQVFVQPDGGRVKVWTDVTEKQRPELKDERLLDLLKIAQVGLIVHGADGELLYTNSRYFSEMFLHLLTRMPDIRVRRNNRDYWIEYREIFEGDPGYERLCTSDSMGPLSDPATFLARNGRWYRIVEQWWEGGIASVWTDVTDLVEREKALEAAYREVIALNAQLRDRSETDSLTGLPNRRRFDHALAVAQRVVDGGRTFSVAVVDIDHFKEVNDRFGHQVGDAVLIEVGIRMRESLGSDDTLARLGGEEFGVIFADVDLPEASNRAQLLLDGVASLRCTGTDGAHISTQVSIGVALMRAHEAPSDAMRRADLAMFQAKAAGRNRIRVAG